MADSDQTNNIDERPKPISGDQSFIDKVNGLLLRARSRREKWQHTGRYVGLAIGLVAGGVIWKMIGFSWLIGIPSLLATTGLFWFVGGLMGYSFNPDAYLEAKQIARQWAITRWTGTLVEAPVQRPEVAEILALNILPNHDRAQYDDSLLRPDQWSIGCHLEERRTRTERDSNGNMRQKTYWVTVFRGRCYCLPAPIDFDSKTMVLPRGVGAALDKQSYSNPEFRKKWNVFSDDGMMAHYIIGPLVSERLVTLKKTNPKLERLCFNEDKVYLFVQDHYRPKFLPGHGPIDQATLPQMMTPLTLGHSLWQAIWPGRTLADAIETNEKNWHPALY